MPLDEDNLSTLCEELHDAAADWKSIGTQLKVNPGELQNHVHKDNKTALMDMLIHILRNFEIGWEDIVRALDAKAVGRKELAKKIRDKYCPTLKLRCDSRDNVDLGELILLQRILFFMLLLF